MISSSGPCVSPKSAEVHQSRHILENFLTNSLSVKVSIRLPLLWVTLVPHSDHEVVLFLHVFERFMHNENTKYAGEMQEL